MGGMLLPPFYFSLIGKQCLLLSLAISLSKGLTYWSLGPVLNRHQSALHHNHLSSCKLFLQSKSKTHANLCKSLLLSPLYRFADSPQLLMVTLPFAWSLSSYLLISLILYPSQPLSSLAFLFVLCFFKSWCIQVRISFIQLLSVREAVGLVCPLWVPKFYLDPPSITGMQNIIRRGP